MRLRHVTPERRTTELLGQHLNDLAALNGAQGAVDHWTATSGPAVIALVASIDAAIGGIAKSLATVERTLDLAAKLHARATESATAADVDPPAAVPDPVEQITAGLPGRHRHIFELLIRSGVLAGHAHRWSLCRTSCPQ